MGENYCINKTLLIKEYLSNKKPIRLIAKEVNSNYSAIRNALLKFNIPIRMTSETNTGKNNGNYKDGRSRNKYFCIDCDKNITRTSGYYGQHRCKVCARKHDWKNSNKLKDRDLKGQKNPMYGKRTHSIGAYYNDIWMRSSYEILFAQFLDLNNIKWLYEPKTFGLGNTTYTPDFYIPNWDLYIEIKGYWYKLAKDKFKLFKKLYTSVKIEILNRKSLEKFGIID